MLHLNTIHEIESNINTGVEYEIALFYCLISQDAEKQQIMQAINKRNDAAKVKRIIARTSILEILNMLKIRGLHLIDCTFETQNDNVGPADVVLKVANKDNEKSRIGLSVKFSNTCTLNVTGRRFITDDQIATLRAQLPEYTEMYVREMTEVYGSVGNWFRKRKPSRITDLYIDLIRDAVLQNWVNLSNKQALLEDLYQSNSPIEYWVFKYTRNSHEINETPLHISAELADTVRVEKFEKSYVAFYIGEQRIGHMQVKFNNGFVEKCKKKFPDIIVEGVPMSYGQPFTSWNFSIEE